MEQAVRRGLAAATAGLVCTTSKGHEMRIRAVPGTRIANPATGEIIYAPPEGRDVIALEHTPDGFDLYLSDSPNSGAEYDVTIAIPRRR